MCSFTQTATPIIIQTKYTKLWYFGIWCVTNICVIYLRYEKHPLMEYASTIINSHDPNIIFLTFSSCIRLQLSIIYQIYIHIWKTAFCYRNEEKIHQMSFQPNILIRFDKNTQLSVSRNRVTEKTNFWQLITVPM